MTDDDPLPARERLDLEKARLECEKLEAEIAEARLAWWKRPAYIGGMIPIVLAVIGFLTAVSSGYFDVAKLKVEKNELVESTDRLRAEQAALERQTERTQDQVDQTFIDLVKARGELDYGIGHLRACGDPLSEEDRALLDGGGDVDTQRNLMQRMAECIETVHVILPIAEDLMAEHQSRLMTLPASSALKDLTYSIAEPDILTAPDGRVYHIASGTFYESDAAMRRALAE